jgi:hypothetical protein
MNRRLALAFVCVGLAACDSPPAAIDSGPLPEDAFATDTFVPPDAWTFTPADHAPAPTVTDQHGPRLTHPQLVIITYADDTNRATIEAHAQWLVGSHWLTSVGTEYGIGAGSILQNVERADDAPTSTTPSQIEALLASGLADHSLPAAADGTFEGVLYVIYFPMSTRITDPVQGDSCHAYGGYHYESTSGGHRFSFAVIPACHGFNPLLADLDSEEEAAAHEIIEAATDPFPVTAPAFEYSRSAISLSPWLLVGPELADLCALRVSTTSTVRESGFVAPRIWSNAAAIANDGDPCVPAVGTAPYASISISPYEIRSVPAGTSTTFDIVAWSTAPVAAFGLSAVDNGGTIAPTVSLDRHVVNNGDHATLTVSVPAGAASGSYGIIDVEIAHSATDYEAFPVVVAVP